MNYLSHLRNYFAIGCCATTLGIGSQSASAASIPDEISFNQDIRPILSEHCYACHGPDEGQRKAGLRLDIEEEALKTLKSGNRAILPGSQSESQLIARIQSDDLDEIMPPPKHGKPLNSRQKDLLAGWIQKGAKWEGHWAYISPKRPALPELKNPEWANNPIDNFIKAKHEAQNLPSSSEAPKTKLIRRASLDLTGLPPSVEEIDAFLEDDSEEAYESLVDRLLDSKHYGERQAMFWLDLARYGETQGFHHDAHRDMWHWRDWVINSYNDNKPFDEFTIEQLAGDLLPNPSNDQLVATGFHRNEMTTSEGGALPEEYSVKYVVGRVDTTARVWLGTSLACAECHDHKYDPISQKDYYRFFAYFNNVPEDGLDRGKNPRPRVSLSDKDQDNRLQELSREHDALKLAHTGIVTPPNETYDEKQKEWVSVLEAEGLKNWSALTPSKATANNGSELEWDANQIITAKGTLPDKDEYTLEFHTDQTDITALRLEAIPDLDLDHGKSGRSEDGDFVLTRFEVSSRTASKADISNNSQQPTFESWRQIGPFEASKEQEQPLDIAFGPESNLDFTTSYQPSNQTWSEASKDLAALTKDSLNEPGIYYFASEVVSKHATTANVQIETKSDLHLWSNWKQIQTTKTEGGSNEQRFKLPLEPGLNRLLVKLHVTETASQFSAQISDPSRESKSIKIETASASLERSRYGISGTLDDKIETGWSVWNDGDAGKQTEYAWFKAEKPFGTEGGTAIRVKLSFNSPLKKRLLGKFRLAISTSTNLNHFLELPQNIKAELVKLSDGRIPSPPQSVQVHYREQNIEEAKQIKKLLDAKRKERDNFKNALPVAMVMGNREKMKDTFMLVRGEYNNPGEKVSPGIPSALFPTKPQADQNRLALAKWLVDPDHPLTSRVIVNHYWQQFFGTGIVKTPEDFGSQGEWPSHPELLDWLAKEFVESGWDIKHMHKLIVTSATYRQDSMILPSLLEQDSGNRSLSYFPRMRLEAEAIRDVAMAASGLLDTSIGGESIYPYQPPGLWEQVAFQGTRKWNQSEGEKNYRRGLYVYWRRSIPYASFVTFDAPSRETCTVKRPRTNTPLQALVLMNDPVYVEAACSFGLRIMTEGGDKLDERLRFAFRVALSRAPSDDELSELRQAFLVELSHFESDRPAANQLVHVGESSPPLETDICELAAWTIIGNILLNLDETITKG
jgi:hypothetical protein